MGVFWSGGMEACNTCVNARHWLLYVLYVEGTHISIVPNRGARPTILLRESYRAGKKVKKRTIANLSHLPMREIEFLRAVFQGVDLQPAGLGFVVERSQPAGHVEAVHRMMARLNLPGVIAGKPAPERDIVLALIAARILDPQTKLATTRSWAATTSCRYLWCHRGR